MDDVIRKMLPHDQLSVEFILEQAFKGSSEQIFFFRSIQKTARYDPKKVFVFETNKKIVGFIFSISAEILIDGEFFKGEIIPLLAVLPKFQKKGIGHLLLEKVHQEAYQKKLDFCLLHGHSSFYKKLGYRAYQFGECFTACTINKMDFSHISSRPLSVKDIKKLKKLWFQSFKEENLALIPLEDLSEWRSFHSKILTSVFCFRNNLVAYMRFKKEHPEEIIEVLFEDSKMLKKVLAFHCKTQNIRSNLKIPLRSDLLQGVCSNRKPEVYAMDGAMILSLKPHSSNKLNQYIKECENDEREIGNWIFPPVFELINQDL